MFRVKKDTCCRKSPTIGEIAIDCITLWNQPSHSFLKKWGKLDSPFGTISQGTRGYIQIDLSIISRRQSASALPLTTEDTEDIEENLLNESKKIQNVNYSITIYKGVFVKKCDYLVQISFAGLKMKTKPKKSANPEWNEDFSINWFYPALTQNVIIQIMTNECFKWNCLSTFNINFNDITIPDDRVPNFGPTYLNFYDAHNKNIYVGRLLFEIKCKKLKSDIGKHVHMHRTVPPIVEDENLPSENFLIEWLALQGDFIVTKANNIKLSMKCAEFTSKSLNCLLRTNQNMQNLKYFTQDAPIKAITMTINYPDCRHKYEIDHYIWDLIRCFLQYYKQFQLDHFDEKSCQAQYLCEIILSFQKKLNLGKAYTNCTGTKPLNEGDSNRVAYVQDYLTEQSVEFESYRNRLKSDSKHLQNEQIYNNIILKLKEFRKIAKSTIQDNWPDLLLILTIGSKEVAICRVNAKNYIFSDKKGAKGRICGKKTQFIFKPISCAHTCKDCGCIFAKLNGLLWIGTNAEHDGYKFEECLEISDPNSYSIKCNTAFNLNIYVHQAKVHPGGDSTGLCDPKVRFTLLESSAFTSTVKQSLSPIWNEIVKIEGIKLPGNVQWYLIDPPLLAIEIFDEDARNVNELLGRSMIKASVKSLQTNSTALFVENTEIIKKLKCMNHLKSTKPDFPPPLQWIRLILHGAVTAELLMSCELIEVDMKGNFIDLSPKIIIEKEIPVAIHPVFLKYNIDIAFFGLRELNSTITCCSTYEKYKIVVNFGSFILNSSYTGKIFNHSLNFTSSFTTGYLNLPQQLEYWPPLIFTLMICSKKKETAIGAALINDATKYLLRTNKQCNQNYDESIFISQSNDYYYKNEKSSLIDREKTGKRKPFYRKFLNKRFNMNELFKKSSNEIIPVAIDETNYNWWTKFYNSLNKDNPEYESQVHTLTIFQTELENQPEFNYLKDWAEPVTIMQKIKKRNKDEGLVEKLCDLKCKIKIKCDSNVNKTRVKLLNFKKNDVMENMAPPLLENMTMPLQETKIIVRVYIVQGLKLRPKNSQNASNAFIKIQLNRKKIVDRANYIPNQSNPIFGKRFQLEAIIPREHILNISLYDHGFCDDLIGSTKIDLEDRLQTKHRATIGLANEFNNSGYNIWHDSANPKEILKKLCSDYKINDPIFSKDNIQVGSKTFPDSTKISKDENIEERLSLTALKNTDKIPEIGFKLVPEHVETRSLYIDARPGIEQGKIQLWVEIFNPDNVPYPIDITPMPFQLYEVRVVVLNTADVLLDEQNVFGTKMSDIYIKCWLGDIQLAQSTDTHYRSLNGTASFNWRMKFSIRYSINENMMIVSKKGKLSGSGEGDVKQPPNLILQMWDDDSLSKDDFICALTLNLSKFPEPSKTKNGCNLNTKNKSNMNLFSQKKIKGWFPCKGKEENIVTLGGKVELEISILNENEATFDPAGIGREPPKALPFPERGATSFNPLTNPMKALKHIIIPQLKKCACYCCIYSIISLIIFYNVMSLTNFWL